MPQMDKEIFIEYLFCIFLILLQSFSNETITENFLKINGRFFLYNFYVFKKNLLLEEKKIGQSIIK